MLQFSCVHCRIHHETSAGRSSRFSVSSPGQLPRTSRFVAMARGRTSRFVAMARGRSVISR
eukprot:3223238-Rhodomonas_salina.1